MTLPSIAYGMREAFYPGIRMNVKREVGGTQAGGLWASPRASSIGPTATKTRPK